MDALLTHRLHFAFTITFHYLFPQLTMGLAPLIVIFKTMYLRTNNDLYNRAARFWMKIFGINFIMGTVTGIPMEFEFGTNWAQFSRLTGGVIGQPLVMEGVFSFFLESAFLGLFLYHEQRLSRWGHWWAGFAVFLGSWMSGFFIIVTDAWMQHPVAFARTAGGRSRHQFLGIARKSLGADPVFPYHVRRADYGHIRDGSHGSLLFVQGTFVDDARAFLRVGVILGAIACALSDLTHWRSARQIHGAPSAGNDGGDGGFFKTEVGAPIVVFGQPDVANETIDNPLAVNDVLSFLAYGTPRAEVRGLSAFPRADWPDNVPLVYYAYHIMVGLGTIFVAVMWFSLLLLWRGMLYEAQWMLWILMLCAPFPYIANTAGWMTAELGRQPWVVYGLLRTADGYSKNVNSGNALFTLLGFMGLYVVLAILFLFLVSRTIAQGPAEPKHVVGAPLTTV